jgi:hypothetical protein
MQYTQYTVTNAIYSLYKGYITIIKVIYKRKHNIQLQTQYKGYITIIKVIYSYKGYITVIKYNATI